jgi:hypothetical protein
MAAASILVDSCFADFFLFNLAPFTTANPTPVIYVRSTQAAGAGGTETSTQSLRSKCVASIERQVGLWRLNMRVRVPYQSRGA